MAGVPPGTAAFDIKAREYTDLLFGKEALDKLRENLGDPDFQSRGLFEKHKAITQCNNVLKYDDSALVDKTGKWIPGKTPCWLCGIILQQGDKVVCEHALPVVQAVLLWGLWEKDLKVEGTPIPPEHLRLEYGWAHAQPCNSVKSAMVFLKTKNPNPADFKDGVEVNKDLLNTYLTSVGQTLKKTGKLTKDLKVWKNERAAALSERFGKMAEKISEVPGVSLLAGMANFLDPSRYNELERKVLFGEDFKVFVPILPSYQAVREDIQRYAYSTSGIGKAIALGVFQSYIDDSVDLKNRRINEELVKFVPGIEYPQVSAPPSPRSSVMEEFYPESDTSSEGKPEKEKAPKKDDPQVESILAEILSKKILQVVDVNDRFIENFGFIPYYLVRNNSKVEKAPAFGLGYLQLAMTHRFMQKTDDKIIKGKISSYYDTLKRDFLKTYDTKVDNESPVRPLLDSLKADIFDMEQTSDEESSGDEGSSQATFLTPRMLKVAPAVLEVSNRARVFTEKEKAELEATMAPYAQGMASFEEYKRLPLSPEKLESQPSSRGSRSPVSSISSSFLSQSSSPSRESPFLVLEDQSGTKYIYNEIDDIWKRGPPAASGAGGPQEIRLRDNNGKEYIYNTGDGRLVEVSSSKRQRLDRGGRRKTWRRSKKPKRKTFRNRASQRTSPGQQRRQSRRRTR